MKNTFLRFLSIILFSVGTLVGMAFFVSATWGDVESAFYGFNQYGNETTTSMHCPILVTRTETATIRATFKNTAEKVYHPNVKFQVGRAGAFREETTHLSLEPGEETTVEWTVTAEDMALERFIFVKMSTFASYPLKDVEQTCGMLVLDLPGLSGGLVSSILVTTSLFGMGLGCLLWAAIHRPLKYRPLDALRAMISLAVAVTLGIVSALLAIWLAGVLLTALALILTGVILGNFITIERA